jgi:hypothetical protein
MINIKKELKMSDTLNKKEVDQLLDLFNRIKLDLSDSSFPTRTNRLEAVENMKRVLKIHGYTVLNGPEICTPDEMTSGEKTRFADALDHHQIMQKGIVR